MGLSGRHIETTPLAGALPLNCTPQLDDFERADGAPAVLGSTNLCSNPGFETDLTGWTQYECDEGFARSTSWSNEGSASCYFKSVAPGAGIYPFLKGPMIAVTPGLGYRVSATANILQAGYGADGCWIRLEWRSGSSGENWLCNGSGGAKQSGTGVKADSALYAYDIAPPGATFCQVLFMWLGGSGTVEGYLDSVNVKTASWIPQALFSWNTAYQRINSGVVDIPGPPPYWGNMGYGGAVLPADQEAWVDVDGTGGSVVVYARVVREVPDYSVAGYRADFNHAGGIVTLFAETDDVDWTIAVAPLTASADGDRLGITTKGSVIEVWRKSGSTITTLLRETVNAFSSGGIAGFAQAWDVPGVKAWGAGATGVTGLSLALPATVAQAQLTAAASLALPSKVRAVVGASLAQPSKVRTTVGLSSALPSKIKGAVGASVALPAKVRAAVGLSIALPAKVRTTVGLSAALPSKLRTAVGLSSALPSKVKGAAGLSAALPSKIKGAVGLSAALPAKVRAAVGLSLVAPSKVRVAAGSSLVLPAKVRVAVGLSLAEPYKVRTAVGSSAALPSKVKAATGTSAALPSHVLAATGAGLALPSRIKMPAGAGLDAAWLLNLQPWDSPLGAILQGARGTAAARPSEDHAVLAGSGGRATVRVPAATAAIRPARTTATRP